MSSINIISEEKNMGLKFKGKAAHFRTRKCSRKMFVFLTTLIACALILFVYNIVYERIPIHFNIIHMFEPWPNYEHRIQKSQDWLQTNCFQNKFDPTLASLQINLRRLHNSSNEYCKKIYTIFSNIYTASDRIGEIRMSKEFHQQVAKWLRNDESLLKDMNHQVVIHIYNNYMREHAAFSPLRAKRPQSSSGINSYDYTKKLIEETAKDCDFCNYKKRTSEDVFGRFETNHSATAANTFKIDRWHSLVFTLEHSLIEINEDDVVDMFETAKAWMKKVHSMEPAYKYPWILWDAMPHAGASQVHPHIHVGITPDYYVGIYENMRKGHHIYVDHYKKNFFQDLVELHSAFGLAVSLGEATAIAQITSRKDTEVTIIAQTPNKEFFQLVYYTYQAFMDMGFYDFSSLTVFPDMSAPTGKDSLPAIMRIASRGNVADVKSEISTFEFYQFANLNIDPYTVIQYVVHSVKHRVRADSDS